ncbi:helix-turn-helix domain-containing protein [Marinobacterium arenosum]|uniref:helix-turn-helix domain-containing protein n=1 Tax=Marinobacterium arenosum TaxID=2862496 RepID=UPI001C94D548|nr:helix-turn-helix transcriptional regulator [Marinobacterium arenosum]MBY4676340.1 helix-turn-helix domain-containing protein [Marinobacterium arenosum]
MSTLKVQFGQQLKQLRKRHGITQEGLAGLTGLTTESISNIERGIFGPKFDTLEKLADVLEVPVKQLFDFSQPNSKVSR